MGKSDAHHSPYHYVPTEWICALFVSLFALSTFIHTFQAIRYRLWWLLLTAVCCGIGETIGWSARLWPSLNSASKTPFLMHFSPTFLIAANFIILGRIINILGPQYSRLSPALSVGGGQASAAPTLEAAETGARVMLGGIIAQVVAIIIYAVLATEFLIRYLTDKPVRKITPFPRADRLDERVRLKIIGLCISKLCFLIRETLANTVTDRTIYRTIELQDGWTGNALEGMPITVAIYTLNIFHPGCLVFNRDRSFCRVTLREMVTTWKLRVRA
ncbi:hypothetical protein EXIGLDRAFT_815271 [Exidia glandulosa HHB12029]|uniref:RTA1-domain-containing protein n=1 Tax=Exidia glandulosa HHB12029 TaxID=1314781 RepID=A0A165BKS7_EXIGL|nr:hypothetical protein EXIGLDRAFT_815271 [Exidia glandulosa HHB12029]